MYLIDFPIKHIKTRLREMQKGPPFKNVRNAGSYISHNATASLFKSKPSALNFQPQNCVQAGALAIGWVEREPPHTLPDVAPPVTPLMFFPPPF